MITDDEGNDIKEKFKAEIEPPPGIPCPSGCSKSGNGVCICEDLGIFEVDKQF